MFLKLSARAQTAILWWGVIMFLIYLATFVFLLKMLPLTPATWTAEEVAKFYRDNGLGIRIGAMICSWTGAFLLPIFGVISIQLARHEGAFPAWSVISCVAGALASLFFVLPPVLWGTAAYTPERPPEVTRAIHDVSNMLFISTDQFFIFPFIGVVVISLARPHDKNSPFQRWYGYFTLWAALVFEVGAFAFMAKTGPFAWNGLVVYWMPIVLFGPWIFVTVFVLLKALKLQERAGAALQPAAA